MRNPHNPAADARRALARALPLAGLAAVLAACGGGGGDAAVDNGGGTLPPPTATTKTTFVTGAISGFGSVIVNGVRYDTDAATVTREGRPGTIEQLKAGEVVTLKAESDAQGKPHARQIDQDRLAQGTVRAVDVAAGLFTLDGQVIVVDDDTLFDKSIPGGSIAGIAVGDRIEVHGFVDSAGTARATRVDKADDGDDDTEVTGVVTALDAAAARFTIYGQVVDYSTARLEGFPSTGLAEGDMVEVKGRSFSADGALLAEEVEREDGHLKGDRGDEAEVEGLVTRFVSVGDFDVAGQAVTTSAGTAFVNGSAADLALDVKVEVEGELDASGQLVADKVVFKRRSMLKLSASVEAVDSDGGTLQVLGVPFVVNADTRREDDEDDDHYFSLADLRVGDWVKLSGYTDPADGSRMIATKLQREDGESRVEVEGRAGELAEPAFSIFTIRIETTPSTRFEDEESGISQAEFFARASGLWVEVEGSWDGASLLAAEAEIEHEHGGAVAPPPPPPPPPPGGSNASPVAHAGQAATVTVGATVGLDGRGSSDPDGDALTYAWTLQGPAGSAAALTGADTPQPSFVADVAGSYLASLTVSDGSLSANASVTVTAQAAAPAINGAALWTQKCSACHGAITGGIGRKSVDAAAIQQAIDRNRGGMGSLSTLTPAEVQAIADAARAANP